MNEKLRPGETFAPAVAVTAAVALLAALASPAPASGQGEEEDAPPGEFEEWLRSHRADYRQYREEVTEAYRTYYRQQQAAFRAYLDSVAARWGRENALISTPTRWVGYDRFFEAQRSVDFREGEVRVSVLVEDEESRAEAVARLRREVEELVRSKGENPHLPGRAEDQLEAPLLAGQLATPAGEPVEPADAGEFARRVVREGEVETETVEGEDEEERVVASVDFSLVSDHVRERARRFEELLEGTASRFELPAPLLFAVTHTESWFNPRARSPAPAYGLMQLVPRTGARTAYRHVHGEDRVLEPAYLYEPDHNATLGAAYLHFLLTEVFPDVEEARSRLYCAIAAYNTGPANVARTFGKELGVEEAVGRVNRMSEEEVYRRLRSSLPYEETRAYLEKVRERIRKYRGWTEDRARADRASASSRRNTTRAHRTHRR